MLLPVRALSGVSFPLHTARIVNSFGSPQLSEYWRNRTPGVPSSLLISSDMNTSSCLWLP